MSEVADGGASRLERHVVRLLRVYPPAYRADWGEEITGTLLEATPPGRNWPPAREAASVIGGGLRARRAANLRPGLPASLRQAAILGAAVYLVQFSCLALGDVVQLARHGIVSVISASSYTGSAVLMGVLAMLIIAAAWSGRRGLVAAAVAATATPAAARLLVTHQWDLMVPLAVLAVPSLAVLMPLVRRAERLPKSLLWLLCLPVGATVAEVLFSLSPGLAWNPWGSMSEMILMFPYTTSLSLVTVLVAICWLATDVRPLTGVALAFAATRVLYGLAYGRSYGAADPVAITVAIAISLVLGCALVWLLRRQARAYPPAAS